MNTEQEYNHFMMKSIKYMNEIRNDFENLSEENKERIVAQANMFLKARGIMQTLDSLLCDFRNPPRGG